MRATREALRERDDWWIAVRSSSTLSAPTRLVARIFADYSGESLHDRWVTVDKLMEHTSLSRRTIGRSLDSLEAAGWMAQTELPTQHRSPRYSLLFPKGAQRRLSVASGEPRSDRESPLGKGRGGTVPARGVTTPTRGATKSPDSSTDIPTHIPNAAGPVWLAGRHEVGTAARAAGDVPEQYVEAVVNLALSDETTRVPAARMAKDPAWRATLVQKVAGVAHKKRDRHRQRVQDCPGCHGSSWREDPKTRRPMGKCDHRELLEAAP